MAAKKLRLYLDTSVISYLDQTDSPEKMAETRLFWEKLKAGEFEIVISDVVNEEIENCDEQKREVLFDYL
ncbi:MAG: PIN domain nuclease, partial [Spirochaetaceae bacterium]|nr:PIN domain nuclease [Spirochaetaceae bacterium]